MKTVARRCYEGSNFTESDLHKNFRWADVEKAIEWTKIDLKEVTEDQLTRGYIEAVGAFWYEIQHVRILRRKTWGKGGFGEYKTRKFLQVVVVALVSYVGNEIVVEQFDDEEHRYEEEQP